MADRGRGGGRGRGRGGGDRGRGGRGGGGGRGDFGGRGGIAMRGGPGGGRGGRDGPLPVFLSGQTVPAPDPKLTALENKQVALNKGKTVKDFNYPVRSGYGTRGVPIVTRVNMFEINPSTDSGKAAVPLYKYNVDTGGDQLSKKKKELVVHAILQRPEFKNIDWATDYANIIVTNQQLKSNIQGEVDVKDPRDDSLPGQPTTDQAREAVKRRQQKFRVAYENSFTLLELVKWLRREDDVQMYQGIGDIVQLLNIVIQKACRDDSLVSSGGQNGFFPIKGHACFDSADLGGGLVASQGFFASVRYSTGRLLLNLNVSHGAFFRDAPLRQVVSEMCYGRNPTAADKHLLAGVEQKLRTLKMMTQYMRPRDATGKIIAGKAALQKVRTFQHFSKTQGKDFKYLSCKETTFELSTGPNAPAQTTSVFDYFRNHHNITLKFPGEPPINVGTRENKNWLPQELAIQLLPGQAYKGLLQGEQTTVMLRFAATSPGAKALAIQGNASDGAGLQTMKLRAADQEQSVQPFGLNITPQMVTVPARILPVPQLTYSGGKGGECRPFPGSWNLQKDRNTGAHYKFFRPGNFKRWQTLTLDFEGRPRVFSQAPDGLMRAFQAELQSYGISMGQGKGPDLRLDVANPTAPNPQARAKTNALLDGVFATAAKQEVDILLVILSDQNPWLYSRIKLYGDVKYGIHTICAVGKKFTQEKNQGMLWGNLALKFNIKGGGVNHAIPAANLKPFDNKTIIFGIDVTHPSPTSSEGAPSIAAAVANKDEYLCQWPASIRSQERRKEIVSQLKEMVLERFELWRKTHGGGLPNKVIVFRDGVSEGQYDQVLEHEATAFVRAFNDLYGAQPKHPKLSIFVVGKRHHIRAYATRQEDTDGRTGNLKAGTIIDRGITHPLRPDFYLQAHAVLQGTGRSAHYDPIRDDIKFTADEIQSFAHNLSYLFNRATKSVSLIPPAYYADLACERGRQYLHSTLAEARTSTSSAYTDASAEWTRDVHPKLKGSTFYI